MFRRLFGTSDAQQLQFLEVRSIATIVILVVSIIVSFFLPQALAAIGAVMLFVWGWPGLKKLFGITTIGALFFNNIVIGVVLFLLYIIAAYLAGVVVAFLGIGRWIYLKVKYSTEGSDNG